MSETITTAFPSPLPSHALAGERPTGQAMRRGAASRCPACGEGRLFSRFLKVADHCPSCNEALHHHRADDGPAYVTIVIVSHLLSPILMIVFLAWRPSTASMVVGFLGAAVVMSLLLLPPIKGAFVGLQWARRMHGFGRGEASTE
ncbi:DUF983 domain-containing protein [Paracoccus sp. S-4012]|uniref:DUF983 domain-containing protein n=1 Tax=Paracoccus sp. S-4012 TaxID=2665648 RepID=UPI0012AFFD2C|nr:DUF983 domain-containing protein [Paracoccus sp. S-4012]MRX51267.1 DUF983 domain-containing protein [Paracoccus sp. S-4012]